MNLIEKTARIGRVAAVLAMSIPALPSAAQELQLPVSLSLQVTPATLSGGENGKLRITALRDTRIAAQTIPFKVQSDDPALLRFRVSDGTIPPGGQVVYSLTVGNSGPDPADNVVVTDNLPVEFSWTGDDCGAGPPAGGPPNGVLTWLVGTLPVNGSATCNVTGTVDGPPGTVVLNDASAVSDSEDPTPATAVATVVIQLGVLEIPTLSKLGLGLLLLLLAGAAVMLMRRSA